MCTDYIDRWDEGILQMAQWIREGKLKTREHIVEGFERMPEAFISLFTTGSGGSGGKVVVKV